MMQKMKGLIRVGQKIFFNLASVCLLLSVAKAQQSKITLNVGNPAPAITVGKWLKGTPVPQLDKDKMYIVEFWATWCGPCIKNIPHLSAIAKKYAGKITVIGVDVWENLESKKSYEDNQKVSQKFVDAMGKTMDYTVAADNKAGDMGKNWLTAGGFEGIPASFLIKNGIIVWKGHPAEIDSIITGVLAGTYVPKTGTVNITFTDVLLEKMKPLPELYKNKNYAEAITVADSLIAANKAESYDQHQYNGYIVAYATQIKFNSLLEIDPSKGVSYLRELNKDTTNKFLQGYAQDIIEKGIAVNGGYQLAIDILLREPKSKMLFVYPYIATAYFKMGDAKQAVSYQQQAVSAAEDALKNKMFVGTIRPDVIDDMKATLAKYQSQQ